MDKKTDEGQTLVWKDDSGTYKLGYSQFLQMRQLQVNKFLLIAVVALIVMLGVAFVYGYTLIDRIDKLNVIGKLATGFLI